MLILDRNIIDSHICKYYILFRENKNRFLFGFLHALVDLRIVDEVTLDFMLPGHTGKVL
jgi:hypothetical protein